MQILASAGLLLSLAPRISGEIRRGGATKPSAAAAGRSQPGLLLRLWDSLKSIVVLKV